MRKSIHGKMLFILALLPLAFVNAQNPPGAGPPGNAPPGVDHKSINPDEILIQACMDKQIQTNPAIKQRYSDSILRDICKRNVEWQRTLANVTQDERATESKRPQFTQSQLSWLQSLQKCKDLSCICGTNPCPRSKSSKSGLNSSQFDPPLHRHKRQDLQIDDTLQERIGPSVRNEIRQMSDEDRQRYFRALNSLKFDRVDGMSKFDILVLYHTPEYAPEAHFSAALLPYHREFLKNFEIILRMIDQSVSLPYWDSTMDAPLPNPADSILWTSEFFGDGFGDVTSGPFGEWFALRDSQLNPSRSGRITRNIGGQGSLLTDQDIDTIMSKPRFRNLVFCVDPFLETAHGANHMWVGGHMLTLRISPNDPVFHSLHAFIDLIWEQWRSSRQNYDNRPTEYVFDNEACNRVSTFNARMQPFSITNSQGLANYYTEVFYSYSNRPQCPNCGSKYLFCDTRQNKCVSKVRSGGACNGFEGLDICYKSRCVNGRCSGNGGGTRNRANSNNNNRVSSNGNASCRNNHACCTYWASMGECSSNSAWMSPNCRSACGLCSGNAACSDSHPRCSEWSSQGECQANQEWMSTNCMWSCGSCSWNFGSEQCGGNNAAPSVKTCRNNSTQCIRWANTGECTRNPDWMLPNCRLACNNCS